MNGIDDARLLKVIKSLEGDFNQVPPIFSAKKIKGKPAYAYARNREKIIMEPKVVKIYNIDFISFDGRDTVIKINCSSGTYIRSVVNIIGKILGCGATLISLLRTKIGSYDILSSLTLDELEKHSGNKDFIRFFGGSIKTLDGIQG